MDENLKALMRARALIATEAINNAIHVLDPNETGLDDTALTWLREAQHQLYMITHANKEA